jgi:hypothetical protein
MEMTLRNFLKGYGFNKCVSIYERDRNGSRIDYCEERSFSEDDKERLIEKRLDCWNEIKGRKVKRWNIIGGDGYPIELSIELKPEE